MVNSPPRSVWESCDPQCVVQKHLERSRAVEDLHGWTRRFFKAILGSDSCDGQRGALLSTIRILFGLSWTSSFGPLGALGPAPCWSHIGHAGLATFALWKRFRGSAPGTTLPTVCIPAPGEAAALCRPMRSRPSLGLAFAPPWLVRRRRAGDWRRT